AARVGAGLLKAACSFRLAPELHLRVGLVSRATAGGLFHYSIWSFALVTSRMLSERICPQVISARLGVGSVTPQSVAARLVGYANALMNAGTEVLTPVATHHHAGRDDANQQRLFLEGGTCCAAMALFFGGFFLLLGRPFLELWVGPAVAGDAW